MGLLDWILGQQDEIQKRGSQAVYHEIEIDLSKANTDTKYMYWGDQIIVTQIDSEAKLRLNNYENDLIDLSVIRNINTPFKEFYITNSAHAGKLKLLLGSGGIFEATQQQINPINAYGSVLEIGLDELACRNKGQSYRDRRGEIIWWDDFENTPQKWAYQETGVGAVVGHNTDYAHLGGQCMKILTSGTNLQYSAISGYFTPPPLTRIGAEFYLYFDDPELDFLLVLDGWDGSNYYNSTLRFEAADLDLSYKNQGGTYTDLDTDVNLYTNVMEWIYFKLVIDWKEKKYIRCIVGDTEYDLTGFNIRSTASANKPLLNVTLQVSTTDNAAHSMYIDDFILTQNEP